MHFSSYCQFTLIASIQVSTDNEMKLPDSCKIFQ